MRHVLSILMNFYYSLFLFQNSFKLGAKSILFCKFKIRGKNNILEFGSDCTIRNSDININGKNNKIIFGSGVKVYENLNLLIEGDGHCVLIEDRTTIGSAKLQLAESNTVIHIGVDCMLSRNISFNTSDFHSIIDTTTMERINQCRNIRVDDHVWIGNGVYINKGSVIKSNSIIAARSIISFKEFKQNTVIGGIPGKVIRENVTWDLKLI